MLETLLLTIGIATPAPQFEAAPAPIPPLFSSQDDPKDLPDKRDEVKALVSKLKGHAKARGRQDNEAISVIDELVGEFENSGLKDRATIAKEIGNTLREKRKEVDGVIDNKLFIASAVALGRMGPESVKVIDGWIGQKTHKKDIELQAVLIRSLGMTKSPGGVKTLQGLLKHHEARIQAAAAEALGNFGEIELKVRKDIFKEVLQVLTSVRNRLDADLNDLIARERYDVIAAPMITTLQVLSGHDERDPTAWQRWWNKNKKKDWDKEG
jgi:HEAT repeat protein